MKKPEEILKQYNMSSSRVMQQDYRADTVVEAMEEYAGQFKPRWIPVNYFPLQDGMYLQATRHGIHLYPDTVIFDTRGFYSLRDKALINDVAFLMEFAPHPFDDGSGRLIDLKK